MTSKARAERRRHDREQRQGYDTRVGIMVGWSEDDSRLDEVKTKTHDALIELMGEKRSGGVTWRIYTGANALDACTRLEEGGDPKWVRQVVLPIRARLVRFGGLVVIASAPGRHPRKPRS